LIDANRLRKVLNYDPETGVFTRRVRTSTRVNVGDVAGWITDEGYRAIRVDCGTYKAHRLAWLFMTGEWPKNQIDHINRIKNDNRWANLRDVTNAANVQNVHGARSNSKSGFLGVTKHANKFRAAIGHKGKQEYLGLFDTADQAHAAYVIAKRRVHEGCMI
jgi:hypothetical protein